MKAVTYVFVTLLLPFMALGYLLGFFILAFLGGVMIADGHVSALKKRYGVK